MRKIKHKPIRIDCEGLSQKRIGELADELDLLFRDVAIRGESIIVQRAISKGHFEQALETIERYGVIISPL